MLHVTLYNNGFEIEGSTEEGRIDTELSLLAWSCANTMHRVDPTSSYGNITINEDEKTTQGMWMTFDTLVDKAVWVFDEFKENFYAWGNEFWGGQIIVIHDVSFLKKETL